MLDTHAQDRITPASRVYRNHHLDSSHWNGFEPRDGDIVLSTSIKSGTTWMQYILMQLVFDDREPQPRTVDVSPWLDERTIDLEATLRKLEDQPHKRIVKSHLPLDGIPFHERVRYVIVARDARDVFMSLWNHYRHLSPHAYAELNGSLAAQDPERFPPPPDDLHTFWRQWMTSGWFDWESDGYPFWSNLGHTRSWWNARHLDNVLLVHFNDLLSDPAGEIARVAEHVRVELDPERLERIVSKTAFGSMKRRAHEFLEGDGASFVGGASTFIFKGTNGRWRGELTEAELKLHDAAIERELSASCAAWLASGRSAVDAFDLDARQPATALRTTLTHEHAERLGA